MLTPVKNNREKDKPIFTSWSYLQSSIGFCDLCFSIVDPSKELYFTCLSCEDFIVCLHCMKHPEHRLISHSSDHLFSPYKLPSNLHWINRNLSITCNQCSEKHFPGKRYRCRQCFNYNLCSNCFEQIESIHEQHTLDFIPNWTKISCNRMLLAERTIQILRYRNARFDQRDSLTGWTSDHARLISEQSKHLCLIAWKEAREALQDEDIDSPASIIEHEKSIELFLSL